MIWRHHEGVVSSTNRLHWNRFVILLLRTIFVGIIVGGDEKVVDSFLFSPNHVQLSQPYSRNSKRNWSMNKNIHGLLHSQKEDIETSNEEKEEDNFTRRELLQTSCSSALSIALSFMGKTSANAFTSQPTDKSTPLTSSIAYASSSTPTTSTSTTTTSFLQEIPFSSIRTQKFITLPHNRLKVLLVTDKRAMQSSVALVINGPGQFADLPSIPGMAHLMEHMILSYRNNVQEDFDEWLSERGGVSNAFTAYSQTCFHFNCPRSMKKSSSSASSDGDGGGEENGDGALLGRALERFASLFIENNVVNICRNPKILAREIRRVDSELDLSSLISQEEYVTKLFVNNEHPYSKFSQGSLETLETIPKEKGINVGEKLIDYFRKYFLPSQAVLVVVSAGNAADITVLERWVTPFDLTLSKKKKLASPALNGNYGNTLNEDGGSGKAGSVVGGIGTYHYPGQFLQGKRNKHVLLYRSKENSFPASPLPSSSSSTNRKNDSEKMILQWVINEDYRGAQKINVVEIAFVLDQILGRRGPGSLYLFLKKRGWIQNTSTLPLHFSVPVNVSGFQILKLELSLTLKGFLERSRIVAAIYESIETLRNDNNFLFNSSPKTMTTGGSFVLPREIISQYATIAKLYGYYLAPRPADAIELAWDSLNYGIQTVQSGKWYRFPPNDAEDSLGGLGLNRMRRAVSRTLTTLSDPSNALIIVTAGDKAIASADSGFFRQEPIPPISSKKWKKEKLSGARVYLEDMLQFRSVVEQSVLTKIVSKEELLPPQLNPLVPATLRPARRIISSNSNSDALASSSTVDTSSNNQWVMLNNTYEKGQLYFPLPRKPPEPSSQSVFLLQFLSDRPSTANAKQAAHGELWKILLESVATDLAELGAPGSLAYEIRFNQYGMRCSFMGLSQTLPSYARRMTQSWVKHLSQLNSSISLSSTSSTIPSSSTSTLPSSSRRTIPEAVKATAIASAKRSPIFQSSSPSRRRTVLNTLQKATLLDVSKEGKSFLQSCSGVVCFSDGDLLRSESLDLMNELQRIWSPCFRTDGIVKASNLYGMNNKRLDTDNSGVNIQDRRFIAEVLSNASWKPRNGSPCYVAGVSLMSDACGRVPR